MVKKKLMLNISNHPSIKWESKQLNSALEIVEEIEDVQFPAIDPHWGRVDVQKAAHKFVEDLILYLNDILEIKLRNSCFIFESGEASDRIVVHVMGEFSFTYHLVREFLNIGVECFVSTSERQSVENPDGTKSSKFEFVKFRKY